MRSSGWSDVRLVAGREVGEKLRNRTFLLSTLFFLVLVAASIALPVLLFDGDAPEYDLAVSDARAVAVVEAVPAELATLTARTVTSAQADRLLREQDVDAVVSVKDGVLVVTAVQEVPGPLASALALTAQTADLRTALTGAGTSPQDLERLLAPAPVQERLLEPTDLEPGVVQLLSSAFALLFFFVVFQFGMSIAQGVVQEKESRVVELLVAAVPIRTLLYGKVLGNGGLALAQVVLLALVAIAGAAATGERELLDLLVGNAGWFVLFFGLGFAMLSCLWAAAGAFASRSDDLQATTLPLQLLVIGPFFAGVYVSDGPARTVMSFVPLTSPIVMPGRLLDGDAGAWEALVAALLLLLTAAGAVRIGERLYRTSLLRTRGRTSLSQAWSGDSGSC